ncbi:hypothetical protein ABIC74_000220 [Mucilaginibacter rubeus]
MPPSTGNTTPVTQLDPESINSAVLATISSTSPLFCKGIVFASLCWIASIISAERPAFSKTGVSVGPGATQFTRMPSGASSKAHIFVSMLRPLFAEP